MTLSLPGQERARRVYKLKDVDVEIFGSESEGYADVEVRLSAGAGAPTPSLPTAYIILIDTSKSMEQFEKLEHAKRAVLELLESMGDDDLVAVYKFDDDVKAVIPLTTAAKAREEAKKVERIKVGNNTLLYEAVAKAMEDLRRGPGGLFRKGPSLEGYAKKIVVVTDGDPWPTYTDPRYYEALGKTAFKYGITISAIGIGDDYNEEVLYKLTSSSGGAWYHISKTPDLSRVLAHELRRAKSIALARPVVEVQAEGAQIVNVRKIGATVAKLEPTPRVELEDVVQGEVVSVVYRLKPTTPNYRVKVAVEAEGERVEQELTPADMTSDRTATLTIEFTQALQEIATGGVVKVEVLRAVTETETMPLQWREKAATLIQKAARPPETPEDKKELIHEATTIVYPVEAEEVVTRRAIEDVWSSTATVRDVDIERTSRVWSDDSAVHDTVVLEPTSVISQAAVPCNVVNVDTGLSMAVVLTPHGVLLGRQDFAPIAPPEVLAYVSRRMGSRAHIEVKYEGGKLYVRDAGSRGGTYVGGRQIGGEFVEVGADDVIDLAHALRIRIVCEPQ